AQPERGQRRRPADRPGGRDQQRRDQVELAADPAGWHQHAGPASPARLGSPDGLEPPAGVGSPAGGGVPTTSPRRGLNDKEREGFTAVARGLSNAEIAGTVFASESTVKPMWAPSCASWHCATGCRLSCSPTNTAWSERPGRRQPPMSDLSIRGFLNEYWPAG